MKSYQRPGTNFEIVYCIQEAWPEECNDSIQSQVWKIYYPQAKNQICSCSWCCLKFRMQFVLKLKLNCNMERWMVANGLANKVWLPKSVSMKLKKSKIGLILSDLVGTLHLEPLSRKQLLSSPNPNPNPKMITFSLTIQHCFERIEIEID